MRKRVTKSGLTVNAIAGTHVVTLGFNLSQAKRSGCLGFAIRREDHIERETYWLRGMKTFAATDPGLGPGGTAATREHPIQGFQWADYAAKPGRRYTYEVSAVYGSPSRLKWGPAAIVPVSTEAEEQGTHRVWFNRGAVASQEYARRFDNKPPDQIASGAAYRWLSRGLLEALLHFINDTRRSERLRGAFYEFQRSEVLNALQAAQARGVDVQIVYDDIGGGRGPSERNRAAVEAAGIQTFCAGRSVGRLMHNKFLVRDGRSTARRAVWTGSTNLTENGLFGHSNLGHAVYDDDVVERYLAYWEELKSGTAGKALRTWCGTHNLAPPDPWEDPTSCVFSPRKGLSVLEWYAAIAQRARRALLMTFAFGMHESFKTVYRTPDDVLRFALMEKEGNGAALEQGRKDVTEIRKRRNVVVAIGNNIVANSFDRWLAERAKLTREANVRFVHTKYMIVDPLSSEPIVVTGSANFSKASTDANEENMLVIRGDTRVADIYVGEFMRLYSHYAWRESLKRTLALSVPLQEWKPQYLEPSDRWMKPYLRPGQKQLRREYFSGQ